MKNGWRDDGAAPNRTAIAGGESGDEWFCRLYRAKAFFTRYPSRASFHSRKLEPASRKAEPGEEEPGARRNRGGILGNDDENRETGPDGVEKTL